MIHVGGRSHAVQRIMTVWLEVLLMREKHVGRIATAIEWMMGMVGEITLMDPHI